MTIALAAMHVIEHDALAAQAATRGNELKKQLEALAAETEGIAAVRGRGLMLGVELDIPALSRFIPGLSSMQATLIAQAFVIRLLEDHNLLVQAS